MIQVTRQNVVELLARIGCEGTVEQRGDWMRVFITVPQPDGIPLAVGRVMFEFGDYKWVKWYNAPTSGEILEQSDKVWFNWHHLLHTGFVMDEDFWTKLVADANARADQIVAERKASREELNKQRTTDGKQPRHRKLAPRNPRSAARHLMEAYLLEKTGKVIPLFAI